MFKIKNALNKFIQPFAIQIIKTIHNFLLYSLFGTFYPFSIFTNIVLRTSKPPSHFGFNP